MHFTFTNPQTGEVRSVKQGFSWTLFFFTPFYGIPLFIRGLHLHGAIVALLGAVALFSPGFSALVPLAGLGLIAAMILYGIKGNELTMQNLSSKGWVRARSSDSMPAPSPHPSEPEAIANPALSATPLKSSWLPKALGIGAAVIAGLIGLGALFGDENNESGASQPNVVEEGEQVEAGNAEADLAAMVQAGDGSVCAEPALLEMVWAHIMNEDGFIRAYPDINPSAIREVINKSKIELPAATVGGIRPDLGVVVCQFGRMSIQVQATADSRNLRFGTGDSWTATNLIILRATLKREIEGLR